MQDDRDIAGCEHEAARLLPWFVTNALSEGDAARVQEHLLDCKLCSSDLQHERQVRELARANPVIEHAPQAGLQKLMNRIGDFERDMPVMASDRSMQAASARRPRVVRWLAAAVVVQALGLGTLGALLWERGAELRTPRFHTLSSPSPVGERPSQIRVVFAPDVLSADIQALLTSISATVTAGPSEAGVYDLALLDKNLTVDAALAQLRANAGVTFAEPRAVAGRGQ